MITPEQPNIARLVAGVLALLVGSVLLFAPLGRIVDFIGLVVILVGVFVMLKAIGLVFTRRG